MTNDFSAWNPGVSSGIPAEFKLLETIFRPDCVADSLADVCEASAWTGLPPQDIAAFRASRLALHELIVRITADFVVPEGETEDVFGKNFRFLTEEIWNDYVSPQIGALDQRLTDVRERAESKAISLLATFAGDSSSGDEARNIIFRFFRQKRKPAVDDEPVSDRDFRIITSFKTSGLAADDALERAVYKSLYRVLVSIFGRFGRYAGDSHSIARLVGTHVCNTYGSWIIGEAIAPLIEAAAKERGFARVPNQERPILISLKGPSAAGKSSLRPQLKQLFREQGIAENGYATISPDVWRRLLLDYSSLGAAYKYAGYLTSREVLVIDGKLDLYITEKAERSAGISNILVDRFRFDSFSERSIHRVLNTTYTRYVHTMYMYFFVTSPEETVVRGWERALQLGRYKSVQDFLGHSVEAYSGMPRIFIRWLKQTGPSFRYVFLDNDVPKNTFPKTIASGNQAEIEIFDLPGMINIERYQKINIDANAPAEVYLPVEKFDVSKNCGFLLDCLRLIPSVILTDPSTGCVYVRGSNGKLTIESAELLREKLRNPKFATIFGKIAPDLLRAIDGAAD